jgi:peptidoglycan hydrolase-like protein with peptidoglycan-binding domain
MNSTASVSTAAVPQATPAAPRRAIQAALARLGYYDGPLDGLFGPDTHAAIRRYQFELKAPMTGTLSAAQAERLRQDGH